MKLPKVFSILLNNGIGLLVPTAIIIFASRSYTPEEVGSWMLFMTITVFLNKFREGVIQAAMIRNASIESKYLPTIKAAALLVILIELFFSLLFFSIGTLNLFPTFTPFFIIYPVYGFGMAFYLWQNTAHQVRHDVKKMLVGSIFYFIFSVLGIGILIINQVRGIHYVLLVQGIGYVAGALAGMYRLPLKKIIVSQPQKWLYRSFFIFGKYGLLRDLFGTLSARIGILLTAGWLTLSDTATLGIVQRVNQIFMMPIIASQMLFFPTICRLFESNDREKLKEAYVENTSVTLAIQLPVVIFISLSAETLMGIFGKEIYTAAAPLLVISTWAISLLSPFSLAFGSMTNAIDKPHLNARIVIINSVLNVILGVVLIHFIGLYGAVIAPVVTDLFGFFWMKQVLKRELKIEFEDTFRRIPSTYRHWVKRIGVSLFVKT